MDILVAFSISFLDNNLVVFWYSILHRLGVN